MHNPLLCHLPIAHNFLTKLCALCTNLGLLGPGMQIRHYHKPPGIIIIMKWSKTVQTMGSAPLLLSQLLEQATYPIYVYQQLIAASPTKKSNQPLLTMAFARGLVVVTTELFDNYLKDMLHGLCVDSSL